MKKILSFAGAIGLAAAVFLTTKNVSSAENTDLQSLSTINSANAECFQTGDPFRDTGHCYVLSGHCYYGTVSGMPLCDPWAM